MLFLSWWRNPRIISLKISANELWSLKIHAGYTLLASLLSECGKVGNALLETRVQVKVVSKAARGIDWSLIIAKRERLLNNALQTQALLCGVTVGTLGNMHAVHVLLIQQQLTWQTDGRINKETSRRTYQPTFAYMDSHRCSYHLIMFGFYT